MASQEVQELLIKAAITLSPRSFMSRFFWLRRKGRSPPCHPSQKLESICKGGAYQDGRSTSLSQPRVCVDGEAGSERCIRSDPNPPTPSPLIQFTWKEKYYMLHCVLFNFSAAAQVFTKLVKPMVGFLRQIDLCIYNNNISGRHAIRTCREGATDNGSDDLQTV